MIFINIKCPWDFEMGKNRSSTFMLSWPTYGRRLRVYSDWTRQRQIDGVKHVALVLEPMLINRNIHTWHAALSFLYNSDAVDLTIPGWIDPYSCTKEQW